MKTSVVLFVGIASTLTSAHPTKSSRRSTIEERSLPDWLNYYKNWATETFGSGKPSKGYEPIWDRIKHNPPRLPPSVPAPLNPTSSVGPPSSTATGWNPPPITPVQSATTSSDWLQWTPTCCDLSSITELPSDAAGVGAASPLPVPSAAPEHILLGRGIQNYTCDLSNSTAVPSPIGAVAFLYDAGCYAASSMDWINALTAASLTDLTDAPGEDISDFAPLKLVGHHFFTDPKSPVFDLNTDNGQLGIARVKKVGEIPAPTTAIPNTVAWLFLGTASTGSDYSGVYRVDTSGGSPPKTCQGQQEAFSVSYAASYWFYR